jgi:hypothetical protein
VERIAVVADRGYFKIEDIEACEKAGIEPYVPSRSIDIAGAARKQCFHTVCLIFATGYHRRVRSGQSMPGDLCP